METQSEAGRGESAVQCQGWSADGTTYMVCSQRAEADEQRDICWRTRPGNQVNGEGVDSLRKHLQF